MPLELAVIVDSDAVHGDLSLPEVVALLFELEDQDWHGKNNQCEKDNGPFE